MKNQNENENEMVWYGLAGTERGSALLTDVDLEKIAEHTDDSQAEQDQEQSHHDEDHLHQWCEPRSDGDVWRLAWVCGSWEVGSSGCCSSNATLTAARTHSLSISHNPQHQELCRFTRARNEG